ncbi:helix-turn-helix transcriptional regulator [Paenibacillus monticola]|uniref:Helix-turn-helix domain-containing protein n=1 Tax=Paenibacillus monticola TaxID=2666075 RepID=A0A7X2HB49_9BACL|nr:helix-turn-helix domain-containing protein [Paenibacillus monticola]
MLQIDRLKKRRLEKKLTHDDMADKLGITRQGYGNYESGKRDVDSVTLAKLVSILDADSDYLLGLTDTPRRETTNMSFYGGPDKYTPDEIEEMEAALDRYRKTKDRLREEMEGKNE